MKMWTRRAALVTLWMVYLCTAPTDSFQEESPPDNQSDSFFDMESMTTEEKRNMIKAAIAITKDSPDIDWDNLRDKYISKQMEKDIRNRRLSERKEKKSAENSDDSDRLLKRVAKHAGARFTRPVKLAQAQKAITRASTVIDLKIPVLPKKKVSTIIDLEIPIIAQADKTARVDTDDFFTPTYIYSTGDCPNDGPLGVPCAPDNLEELCDKYQDGSSLRGCLDACSPSYCCIHDAARAPTDPTTAQPGFNFLAPNCNADPNCAGYAFCYIAWWKLADTVGPAVFLQIEQDDDFFDVTAAEIQGDQTGQELFTQLLLHHFDDIAFIIQAGTANNTFSAERIFRNSSFWDIDI